MTTGEAFLTANSASPPYQPPRIPAPHCRLISDSWSVLPPSSGPARAVWGALLLFLCHQTENAAVRAGMAAVTGPPLPPAHTPGPEPAARGCVLVSPSCPCPPFHFPSCRSSFSITGAHSQVLAVLTLQRPSVDGPARLLLKFSVNTPVRAVGLLREPVTLHEGCSRTIVGSSPISPSHPPSLPRPSPGTYGGCWGLRLSFCPNLEHLLLWQSPDFHPLITAKGRNPRTHVSWINPRIPSSHRRPALTQHLGHMAAWRRLPGRIPLVGLSA